MRDRKKPIAKKTREIVWYRDTPASSRRFARQMSTVSVEKAVE